MDRNGKSHGEPRDLHRGPLTFLDFFAGVGLAEVALEPPWRCIWANDIDPKKKAIYDANFDSPGRYVLADVATVKASALPAHADMAWASFPCQDLSLAGWRRGLNAKRSGVFWSFHRLMHQLKQTGSMPNVLVIENVVGLLYGQNFIGLCEALRDLDLQFGALVMDAKHFIPQSRPRVFIVAVDRGLNTEAFVQESPEVTWAPSALHAAVDALPLHLRERWRWWHVPTHNRPEIDLSSIIEPEPIGVDWHSAEQTQLLLNMMSETNRAKIESALAAPGCSVGFLYRRTRNGEQRAEVRFDGIAGCLRTPNGGSSRQTVVIVEDSEVRSRLLSPREAARLMGAPDSYNLPGRYNDAYKAMGDGVAVPVVKWLSDHLLIPLSLAARIKLEADAPELIPSELPRAWDPAAFQIGAVSQ